jgi:hypothetical protein
MEKKQDLGSRHSAEAVFGAGITAGNGFPIKNFGMTVLRKNFLRKKFGREREDGHHIYR